MLDDKLDGSITKMLITFDTQEVVKELKSHGFTDEQADVLTNIKSA